MTKAEFRAFAAGQYVLSLGRSNPLVWSFLDQYIAGAMAAYDWHHNTREPEAEAAEEQENKHPLTDDQRAAAEYLQRKGMLP